MSLLLIPVVQLLELVPPGSTRVNTEPSSTSLAVKHHGPFLLTIINRHQPLLAIDTSSPVTIVDHQF